MLAAFQWFPTVYYLANDQWQLISLRVNQSEERSVFGVRSEFRIVTRYSELKRRRFLSSVCPGIFANWVHILRNLVKLVLKVSLQDLRPTEVYYLAGQKNHRRNEVSNRSQHSKRSEFAKRITSVVVFLGGNLLANSNI